jgi:5-methyltetrahydrofolate--homocysteine methyltransferase
MTDLKALQAAIEAGDRVDAVRLTGQAIEEGIEPQAILDAMTAAMDVIGRKFACEEIYVPEMLISARAMKEATAILEPVLIASGIRPRYRAVVGTIQGDLHDIGKNLVAMMWRGARHRGHRPGTNISRNGSSMGLVSTTPASSVCRRCSRRRWWA